MAKRETSKNEPSDDMKKARFLATPREISALPEQLAAEHARQGVAQATAPTEGVVILRRTMKTAQEIEISLSAAGWPLPDRGALRCGRLLRRFSFSPAPHCGGLS